MGGYHADVSTLDLKGILQIPNVGKSIGEKIVELLQDGTFADLEALRAQIPPGVRELMSIPGFGPKKAMVLYQELGVASVPELVAAIEDERVAGLKGFGGKTQENILRGLQQLSDSGGRVLVNAALDVAESLLAELDGMKQVGRSAFAGSLRRMRETIGDVDLLVASDSAAPIMDAFVGLPSASRVIAHGDTKSSILTDRGLQVDLRVIPKEVWGAAMIYFTGSKAHNIRIREMAVRAGLKLNEYGLFDAKTGELLAAETEAKVYERLGLPYFEPTLREDRGEVEAALAGELPKVLQLKDLRGDLHTHTNLTDGLAPLEEMLDTAATLGYAYYAVTDHAPNLAMQRMTDDKILAQRERLRALQSDHDMTLLHGTELNIDPDGNVDWPEEFLAGFDITVASVHSHFTQSREEMTRRVIRAMENPYVNVIGHPTGPADRQAAAGRPGPRGGLRGGGAHGHGARGQLVPRPARPEGRAHPVGAPVRAEVRRGHRLAFAGPPVADALRGGDGAARVAHQGRRDQHLAPREAPAVPPQGPTCLSGGHTRRPPTPEELLRAPRHRRSHPTCSAGSWSAGWGAASGSRRGSSRPRRTSHTTRRAMRYRGTDGPQRRDVRDAGASLCVFHVRDASLHERGHGPRRRGDGGAPPRGRADRRRGRDAGATGTRARARALFGPGEALSGVRRRSRRWTAPISSAAPTCGSRRERRCRPPVSSPVLASGSAWGREYAWRFSVADDPFVSRGARRDDRYGLGEDRSFDTVIITELVWNAETPADGLCEMTVPAGWVEIARTTFT